MDLTRLSQGEKIAAGSGILLFIFMFFNWFGVASVDVGDVSVGGASASAWDALDFIPWVLLLAVIAAVGFPLLKATGNELEIPLPPTTIVTALGGIGFLLVLYRIINPPGEGVDREIGVFLGLIAAAGVTFGGYSAMQEEGTSFQDAADSLSGSRDDEDDRGSGSPPPPPPSSSGPPSG